MKKFITVPVCMLFVANPIMAFAILNSVDIGEFATPIAKANESTLLEEPINCPKSFKCEMVPDQNNIPIKECKVTGANQKYFMPLYPWNLDTYFYYYKYKLTSSRIGYDKKSDNYGQAQCSYWIPDDLYSPVEFRSYHEYPLRPVDDNFSDWTEKTPAGADGAMQTCSHDSICNMELEDTELLLKNAQESQILACGMYATCTEENINSCYMEGGDVQFFKPSNSTSNSVVIDTYKFTESQVAGERHVRCKYQAVYSDGNAHAIYFITKNEYAAIPSNDDGKWTYNKQASCATMDPTLCPILATSKY